MESNKYNLLYNESLQVLLVKSKWESYCLEAFVFSNVSEIKANLYKNI